MVPRKTNTFPVRIKPGKKISALHNCPIVNCAFVRSSCIVICSAPPVDSRVRMTNLLYINPSAWQDWEAGIASGGQLFICQSTWNSISQQYLSYTHTHTRRTRHCAYYILTYDFGLMFDMMKCVWRSKSECKLNTIRHAQRGDSTNIIAHQKCHRRTIIISTYI